MYAQSYSNITIKQAQIELLRVITEYGKEVEDTIEIDNISVCIRQPLYDSENLFELVTPIANEHMSQMMLEPDPKLEKTHYDRLHNFLVVKSDKKATEDIIVSYDQVEEVIKRLKENPFSKRCVLTLFQPNDVNDKYSLSWTFAQILIRENKLIMTNYFRSCDIWNAFPWNVFGIAKLQKNIAQRLGIETGEFIVYIGSAHIYKTNINKVKEYLAKT